MIQRDPDLWKGMTSDTWMSIGEIVREIMGALVRRRRRS